MSAFNDEVASVSSASSTDPSAADAINQMSQQITAALQQQSQNSAEILAAVNACKAYLLNIKQWIYDDEGNYIPFTTFAVQVTSYLQGIENRIGMVYGLLTLFQDSETGFVAQMNKITGLQASANAKLDTIISDLNDFKIAMEQAIANQTQELIAYWNSQFSGAVNPDLNQNDQTVNDQVESADSFESSIYESTDHYLSEIDLTGGDITTGAVASSMAFVTNTVNTAFNAVKSRYGPLLILSLTITLCALILRKVRVVRSDD